MPRARPNALQNLLASVILPFLSVFLLPASLAAVGACLLFDNFKGGDETRIIKFKEKKDGKKNGQGCVIISGGRMSKGLTYVPFSSPFGVLEESELGDMVLTTDWLEHSRGLDGKSLVLKRRGEFPIPHPPWCLY